MGEKRKIRYVRRSRGGSNLYVIMPILSVLNMQNADENVQPRAQKCPSISTSVKNNRWSERDNRTQCFLWVYGFWGAGCMHAVAAGQTGWQLNKNQV